MSLVQGVYHTLGRNSHQIIRDGSFATKKEFIQNELFHLHIVEHNIVIQGLLKKLHASLIHEKVPDFYGYYFMGQLTLCSEERMSDSINREIQLLKGKKSHFHLVMKHIEAREACLKSISQCLEGLFQQLKPVLLNKLGEEIKHLRQLTVWVIQHIKQWKNALLFISPNVFEDQHISFFYQGEDYLLKILKDTDFIAKSFLAEKVAFSYKQDPFLMRPCTNDQAENQFTAVFKFSSEQQQRYISCLQFLADERADYLKRKIMAKADKIREIERVYQSRHLNQNIMVTRANPIAFRKGRISINEAPIDFIEESPKQDQTKKPIKSNSLSESRDSKAKQLMIKGEKIRKIKEMEFGSSSPLINIKKFNSVQGNLSSSIPLGRSISLGIIKKMSSKFQKSDQKETETDFESIVRKKELQILDNDRVKRRTITSIKLKDRLSERKLVDNKEGAQQLRKILDQIQHCSPQMQQSFFIRKESSNLSKKTLLQQNQENMLNLRQSILKELADDTAARQRAQEQKREQNNMMEKLIKKKLDQETLKEIQKKKVTRTLGKDVLAHDINKQQLFGLQQPFEKKSEKLSELQIDLKRQMQLKFLREVHEQLKHRQSMYQHQKQKKKQQKVRQKQLQQVIRKQELQNRFKDIQNQQRSKAMQKILEEQEKKKKEIQAEMQAVVQKQQERLLMFSNEQKQILEAQLRQNMKEKLLINLKRERSVVASKKEAEEKQKQLEEQNRSQLRKKMQEEFKVQKNLQRQRQRDEKARKLRLVAQKMDHLSQQQQESKLIREESIKKQKMQQLKQSISNFPIMSTKNQEQNKRKLREQFELQLFAFNRPENCQAQQDNFIIKDYKSILDNDKNLNKKMSEANHSEIVSIIQQPQIIAKQSSLKASKMEPSVISDNFVRFSQFEKESQKKEEEFDEEQLRMMGINMTPAQYTIYRKKKMALNPKRIIPLNNEQQERKKMINLLDKFQKMSNLDSERQETPKIQDQIFDNPMNSPATKCIQEQKIKAQSPKKQSRLKQQPPVDSQDLSDVLKLTVHSKMGSVQKKRFVTSDDDSEEEPISRRKKANKRKSSVKKPKVKEVSEEVEKTFQKNIQKVQKANFKTLSLLQLDGYLITHFKQLPKVLRKLNLFKKDELLKSFEDYKSIMIIEIGSQSQLQGIVFIVENQNKQNIRSLNILHFGAYKLEQTITVLVKARDLLFQNDPCAQITFSMYYNKSDQEQDSFVRMFEKQFDPYGAIFQKKISNDQTQRKHIFRRMIGEQSKQLLKNKAIGQLKVQQSLVSHPLEHSLGVQTEMEETGKCIGSWTLLGIFLSNYGRQEQIVNELTSDVKEQSKNIKLLSKIAMKLKNSRFADIQYDVYQSPFQANLKFIENGDELIKCDPKIQENRIPITVIKNTIAIMPTIPFVSTVANFNYQNQERIGRYLRFKCGKGSKVLKLKSSLYSSVVTVVPCKPSNYKILLTDALEYDSIAGKTSLDLYFKLFLANVSQHSQGNEEFIWIPQISAQGTFQPQYSKYFALNAQLRSKIQISYTEYIPNCLSYQPSHRDIFITPPFLLAIINSEIEKNSEGSPVFLQRIDYQDLTGAVNAPVPPPQSDF